MAGGGGSITDIVSDSLVRLQVYAALSFGARGLYYYCWGHGIWNISSGDQFHVRGTPTPNYAVVKAANADAVTQPRLFSPRRRLGGDHARVALMANLVADPLAGRSRAEAVAQREDLRHPR